VRLDRLERDWQDLATLDPLWAILAEPERQYGRWDLKEFFDTGARDVSEVLRAADRLGCTPNRGRALDFGCGVGRLTRALSSEFEECYGIDISSKMIRSALELNADVANCRFLVNVAPDLAVFDAETFDFVLSMIVLQHMPSQRVALRYVAEFLRVLRPEGLVVFQLPTEIPLRNRRQLRRRAYSLLRGVGVSERFLYARVGLNPVRMIAVPRGEVEAAVAESGGRVIRAAPDDLAEGMGSHRYYVARERSAHWR
jgi:SAM-dependent methyltransferase